MEPGRIRVFGDFSIRSGVSCGGDFRQGASVMSGGSWIYRFGDIEVDPLAHRVTRQGIDLGLEPKAFAVLLALLEESGKALARDDLLDRVWGHRHVTPGVLNRVIGHLRKALGDDAENPRFIQTLHSLGYRFVAEVQRISPDTDADQADAATATSAPAPTTAGPPVQTPSTAGRRATDRTSTGTPTSLPASLRRVFRLTPLNIVVAIVALTLVMLVFWRAEPRPSPPAASIAVLPFTSLSSSADDNYFVEGLTEEMRSALAGVVGLKVAASISPGVRESSADARALGAQLGVASILEASIRRQGTRLRINARLSDTSTGFTLWSQAYDREVADVFDTQSRIANEVVAALLGSIPGESEALRKRLTPTRDVEAYDAFLQGMQLLRQANAAEPDNKAIDRFNHALQKDAGFARAQAGICKAEIRKFENLHNVDAFENARIACQRALNMDSSLAEVSLALGDLYRVQGQPDKALQEYARIEYTPGMISEANIGMAKVYAAQKNPKLAQQHFAKAQAASPDDPFVYSETGYQQFLDGDVKRAIASFRKAVQLGPRNADLWLTLGSLLGVDGDTVQAAQALEHSIAIEPSYAALSNLGLIRYQAGDYVAAAALQRRAVELNPVDFMTWGNLGMALKAGSAPAAEVHAAFAQAADLAQRYVHEQSQDARATAALGHYRAELGEAGQARDLLLRAETLGTQAGEVALLNAETLATLGDLAGARKRLARARKEGIPDIAITSNADFRRLGLLEPSTTAPLSE